MFVLNPDLFLLPSFRISPFQTSDITRNNELPADDFATVYFDSHFKKGHWQYTKNGRQAIQLALQTYNLQREDTVTILTTSQNFYISSCVTSTIEQFCQWNRAITPQTKVILVNHEFGYPYAEMEQLLATGLPIIEDCCTTFFSQDDDSKIGKYGDYAVYSFPKFFPIQLGGLLVSNKTVAEKSVLEVETVSYIQNVISHYLKTKTELLQKRSKNFDYALTLFSEFGFTARFEKNDKIVPLVLLLHNNSVVNDLNQLKIFLNNHGIQNSVFYGEDAFFIPTHQNLTTTDYDYFFNCIQAFLKSQ